MDNYIAIVFDGDEQAFKGLHALWKLDDEGDITVHGAAVIHRNSRGDLDVATKRIDTGLRTLGGAALGALIGALAGPVGSALGIAGAASIVTGAAAAAGAAAGGAAGLMGDAVKAGERDEAKDESGIVIKRGQSAVVAEVSEEWTTPLDSLASRMHAAIYRRTKSAVRDASMFGDEYIDQLYPYDYDPQFAHA